MAVEITSSCSMVTADCARGIRAEYAQVLRMLGNGRLEAQCIDGTKRLCHIRGKMRKKVWVNMVRPMHTIAACDL